jgi:uncharacterized protein DUF2840
MIASAELRCVTRVTLLFLHERVNVWIRFGTPQHEILCNRSRRIVTFAPNAIFCRVHWEANRYGTTLCRLAMMQAGFDRSPLQGVVGVQPGAHLLLEVDGGDKVQQVLRLIDGIEALGIAAQAVAPTYWRVLHHRLLARQPLPRYTAARHAAWLRRNTPGVQSG